MREKAQFDQHAKCGIIHDSTSFGNWADEWTDVSKVMIPADTKGSQRWTPVQDNT